ncbi:MAG: NuoM family protein [Candidatus Dormibacteria bacterium]
MSGLLLPALRGGMVALQLAPRLVGALAAANPAPAPAAPGQGLPGQGLPGQGLPGQGLPGQGVPGQGLPSRTPAPAPVSADLPEVLLSFVVWLTALLALVIVLLPERTAEQRNRIRVAAGAGAGGSFLIALGALFDQVRQDSLGGSPGSYEERHAWLTGLPIHTDYHLAVDGISLPLLTCTTLVFLVAVAASCRLQARTRLFFAMLLLLDTGVSGMLSAADGLLLVLFVGLQLVPLATLLTIYGGPGAGRAARHYLAQAGLGVVLLLVAITLVATRAGQGSTDLTSLTSSGGGVAKAGFWLSLAAAGLLLGVVPLHGWVVDVLEHAPAGVAAAVGGAVLSTGAYCLLRITIPLFGGLAWHYSLVIVTVAVLTTVYATVATLRQRTVRRLAAYTAVSHTGLVLLALGAQSTVALVGAVVALIANGLVVAMAQLLAGQVEERARTGVLDALGGLGRRAPRLAGLWLLAGLSGVGVPLLAGFTGELLVVTGAFPVHRIATTVVVAALLVSTGWLLWTVQRVFSGQAREAFDRVRDVGTFELWQHVPLAAAVVAWGVVPGRVLPMIGNGVISGIVTHLGGRG